MAQIANVKKRISVNLSKAIEPLVQEHYGLLTIEDSDDYKIYFRDRDSNSDLFFGIVKETQDITTHNIHYKCKPSNSKTGDAGAAYGSLEVFKQVFSIWLENLKYYDADSILNDPILRGYQNEFYNDFKIVDDDANETAFNYEQQLRLTEFLDKVYQDIDTIKDERNEKIIEDIKKDIGNLQNSVTTETKNGFMKKLSGLFAKARKGGIKISNFILKEFIKEFLKDGAQWLFNFTSNNAHKLPDYIKHLEEALKQLNG